MPVYVYGCEIREHERIEIFHGFTDEREFFCPECGLPMHKIPQVVTHYNSPRDTLLEIMDRKYITWRTKRKKGLLRG